MRFKGTLRSWTDDRGFGFIAPSHGGAELFVHISAFPRDGSRPLVGERLSYELGRGQDGRPQAVNVQREALEHAVGQAHTRVPVPKQGRARSAKRVGLTLVLALGLFAFDRYRQSPTALAPKSRVFASDAILASPAPVFNCDGRTHCSEMTSCSEAKYFLKHCPGTQMDGDNDGTPCEQQWCTHAFSK